MKHPRVRPRLTARLQWLLVGLWLALVAVLGQAALALVCQGR